LRPTGNNENETQQQTGAEPKPNLAMTFALQHKNFLLIIVSPAALASPHYSWSEEKPLCRSRGEPAGETEFKAVKPFKAFKTF
jgi:hypothetical protein